METRDTLVLSTMSHYRYFRDNTEAGRIHLNTYSTQWQMSRRPHLSAAETDHYNITNTHITYLNLCVCFKHYYPLINPHIFGVQG